ncbi:hypothetical protein [Jatrophihabitans sp.]|jgi:hypothetical protein|uniref:hypothetical protein n=1 Tax=Jatrophihabitans sp. TaxID=1932789 RepID=UPI0038CD5AA2
MDSHQGKDAAGSDPAASDPAASDPAASAEDDQARRAEERFIDDLISRGEAVPEGEELPRGATHEVIRDEDGHRKVRRRRFKAY